MVSNGYVLSSSVATYGEGMEVMTVNTSIPWVEPPKPSAHTLDDTRDSADDPCSCLHSLNNQA